jgi:acyl-CoA thioesterase-1
MQSIRRSPRRLAILISVILSVVLAACSGAREPDSAAQRTGTPAPAATSASRPAAQPARDAARAKIVVLGDSLSAGLGLQQSEAYPALLQKKLDEANYPWDVINAGISGDTTAAGLQRLDWALDQPNVRILVLELGANDGLRGLPVAEMKKNLAAIIERAQAKRIAVLLTGMEAPPNFGPEYVVSFRQAFADLAKQYKVVFLPFLLAKVAGDPSLNQGDGIHPNIEGARIVADNVWTVLKPMVDMATAA